MCVLHTNAVYSKHSNISRANERKRITGHEKDSLLIWLQLPGHKVSSKLCMRVPDGAIKSPRVPEEGGLVG